MGSYLIRRLIYMVILLLVLSIFVFIIIQLPPGDYLSFLIESMRESGVLMEVEQMRALEQHYGLDLPVYLQYFKWMFNLLQGDMGRSFQWNEPVTKLIGERLALTVSITLLTLVLTYLIAIPIGIYSATHQYSVTDYGFTIFGFDWKVFFTVQGSAVHVLHIRHGGRDIWMP